MLLARYTKWNRPCMVFWTRFGLQGTKVGNDAIDMKANNPLLTSMSTASVITYHKYQYDPSRFFIKTIQAGVDLLRLILPNNEEFYYSFTGTSIDSST